MISIIYLHWLKLFLMKLFQLRAKVRFFFSWGLKWVFEAFFGVPPPLRRGGTRIYELPVFLTYRICNFCLFDCFLDKTFFRTRAVISKISYTNSRARRGVARGKKFENRFFCLSHPQANYKCPQKISAH